MGKNLDSVIKSLGLEKTAQRSAEIGVPESRSVESLERVADRHSWEHALEQERRRQQQEQRKQEQAMSWQQKQNSMMNLLQGVSSLDLSAPEPFKDLKPSEIKPMADKAKKQKAAPVRRLQPQIDALEAQKKPVGMDQTNAPHNRQIDEQIKPLQEELDAAKQEAADVNQITLALMSDADRKALSNYVNQRRIDWYDTLTQGVFGQGVIGTPGGRAETQVAELARKYGWDTVKSLAETLERQQNAEATAQAQQDGAELGRGEWYKKILSSAASIPLDVVSGAPAVFERIRGLGTSTGQYPTLDPNNAGNLLGTMGSAIQGQVASDIEGDGSNGWRKAGSMLYRGTMSAAESALRGATGKVGTVLLSGMGSFEQNVAKASAQGASPEKAVTLGLTNAAIEALSEEIPLDNLMEQAKHSGKGFGKALKNALIQAGIEASTEEASLIGTTLAEAAILQDDGEKAQYIQSRMEEGADYETANKEWYQGLLEEAVDTAIVSGISGGMMSGARSVRGALNAARAQQDAQQAEQKQTQRQAAQQPTDTPLQGEAADPRHQKKQQAEAREAAQAMEQEQQAQAEMDAQLYGDSQEAFDRAFAETGAGEPMQEAPVEPVPTQQQTPTATDPLLQNLQTPVAPAQQQAQQQTSPDPVADLLRPNQNPQQSTEQETYADWAEQVSDPDWESKFIDEMTDRAIANDPRRGIADPMADRDYADVGKNRKLNAYQYDHPEVKPYFFQEAAMLASEFQDSQPAQRYYNDDVYYESGGEKGFSGQKRFASESISKLLDDYHMSYDQIEKGIYDIIKDDGAENNAAAKKVELMINDRLMNGYKDFYSNKQVPPNQDYLDFLRSQQSGQDTAETAQTMRQPAQPTQPVQPAQTGDPNSPGIKGTGAAERGFAGPPAYDDLLTDTNSQRDRFDDARPVEVPKTDTQGRTVSEFVGNAYGSALTKESFIPTIKKLVTDGSLSHDVQTNQASLESAAQDIVLDGLLRSLNDVRDTAQSGKVGTNDIAKATLLYQYLCEATDADGNPYPEDIVARNQEWAAEAFASLTQMATASGRNLQLFSLFRQMNPEGQMREIQHEVQAFVRRAKRLGTVDQRYEPQMDTELFNEFRDAAEALREEDSPENRKRVTDAQNAIYADTAAQMPATFKAKWDAWRYMAMMGNVKTQVRNVAGNAMYMPYTEAKRAIGAAIERVALKQDQRTKAVLNLTSESDRQLLQWAKNDSKEGDSANALKYSAKLGDDTAMQEFMGQRRIFDNELLEKARKAVDTATSAGDMVFKNHEYAVSLAGFLKARGYTEADILSGKVSDSTLTEARAYAVNEALKATFNDSNAFSDFLASELRYKGDNPFGKALNTAAEGIMPFRRTPANVVVRAFENSPMGLVKGVWNMATQVKNGNVSAATAIDQISAGLTGTAAMGLGYLLAKGFAGIKLRGSDVDDDEKRQGHQEYALEFSIGGKEYSYTIDWAAPANLPLFVGANLYSALEGSGKDASYSTFTAMVRALGLSFEPMLALSCMSSLNDLIEAGKYSDGNALYSLAAQAATSYLTQGIPSLARQTYQASQKNKQSTFANSVDPLLRGMQRKAAGVPFLGAAFQTGKVDEWGQKESTGSFPKRIFNAYFNPGTQKTIDNSPLEREITRLNGSQPDSVSPPSTAKTITYTDANGENHKDQRLTEEQYSTLTTVQGQTAKDILDGALDSSIYQSMTDEQKAKVFSYTYAYAREAARTEAIDGYHGMDAWMEAAAENPAKAILDKVVKAGFDDAFDSLTNAWEYGKDTDSAVSSLEDAYSVYSGMSKEERKEFKKETGGRVGYFLDAKDAGIDGETFTDLYKTFSDISAQDSKASAKATNWAYYLEKEKSAGHITASQEAALKDSMVYYNIFPAETKKFDQLTDAGLSADNAYKVGKLLDGIQGTGEPDENGEPKVTNQDKYAAIASSDLPEKDKEIALMSYLQGKLGEKYEYARDEMQLTVEDFVDAYRVTSEYSKKKQQISAWMDMGYTKKEANNLYKLYKGKLT